MYCSNTTLTSQKYSPKGKMLGKCHPDDHQHIVNMSLIDV